MISAVLLMGGNVGDVGRTFARAKELLADRVGRIEQCSEQLRSPSWGFDSDEFLNEAVVVATQLDPYMLLKELQEVERECGRERAGEQTRKRESGERYLARTNDIDIIFYGDRVIESEELTIPHRLMAERRFVLEPLMQLSPDRLHPASGKSVEKMLNELNDR